MFRAVLYICSSFILIGCGPSKCTDADKQLLSQGRPDAVSSGCVACMKDAAEKVGQTCKAVCDSDPEKCPECLEGVKSHVLACLP
jgi:hypothetical protein